MKFDPRAAAALRPDGHLLIEGCPGLRLVAGKTRKTWVYRYQNAQGLITMRCPTSVLV